MITKNQTTQLLEILFGAWGGLPDESDLINAFHYAWEQSEFRDVQAAVARYIRTEEKRPTPAAVMRMIVKRPANQEADREFVLKYLKLQMARGLVAVFEERTQGGMNFGFVHKADAIRMPGHVMYCGVHVPRFARRE